MTWNLKFDVFPNINTWIKNNWTAPYGSEVAERYLYACMAERSASYHGNQYVDHREKNDAYKALKKVIADLKGDALKGDVSPSRVSSALRRIASAIDNSKYPSRDIVARDLTNLIHLISSGK
jgi:hypothetical protein